ncbi:alanyl-tRNA editing protein [Trinickia diaoshuihuensis]|uniref:alanyl-tRNA editing protein n=1 Tax=Trinickia diaoshuihuensis TaxID=2292265 RepID=UPI000E287BFE|nr:alanyl-tRNA editing protein [Trinickia diaoshuihuensis]
MFSLSRKTRKLYYEDVYLSECVATIVKVQGNAIELDRTVAYPEGGGQEADQGVIVLDDGREMRFVDARKMYGNALNMPNFPDIQVDGIIEHVIHESDVMLLRDAKPGSEVIVRIDRLRRAQLSLSHTASHLMYLGVCDVRPDAITGTIGCHIKPSGARFDFVVETRFAPDEVREVARIANAYVARGSEVKVYPHPDYLDARYWECEQRVIPCGGTHISSTTPIGPIQIQRKSLGRGKDRLSCEFRESMADPAWFHP